MSEATRARRERMSKAELIAEIEALEARSATPADGVDRPWKALHGQLVHLARLNTMGEMAAGFAHELNQPLAAIMNYANGLLRRIGAKDIKPEELVRPLQSITAQAMRTGEIVRRIRRFAASESGTIEPTNVNDTVRTALDLLRGEALSRAVNLTADLAPVLRPVLIDGMRLEQAVVSLVQNGLEAIPDPPWRPRRVTVTTTAVGDMIRVSVDDSGSGIPGDLRDRVLEPFFTTKRDGLGIGLCVCRSIAEEIGGDMAIGEGRDGGTEVVLTLPAMGANAAG